MKRLLFVTVILFGSILNLNASPFDEKSTINISSNNASDTISGTTSATTTAKVQESPLTLLSKIQTAFLELEIAILNFRNMEIAITGKSGFFLATGYTVAATALEKKRDAMNSIIETAKTVDLPEIQQVVKAYNSYYAYLKGYLTVAKVGGIISGPNSRKTAPNFTLLAAANVSFKIKISNIISDLSSNKTIQSSNSQ
ncbi:MAG: hypothetical protein HQM10_11100 [Candidatus Riflebacteria bacterium]|nr:hypothetical protein [Candidatus Riflebacteria bacterium]